MARTSTYHPRRGNGPLFARYEKMLGKCGLHVNIEHGNTQWVIVPSDQTPPLHRNRRAPLEVQDKYGIIDGMRSVPICIREREVPHWTLNDRLVREFIRHRFPQAFRKRPSRHFRHRAAELAAILYMTYRLLWPYELIGQELRIEPARALRIAHDAREHGKIFFDFSSPYPCCRNYWFSHLRPGDLGFDTTSHTGYVENPLNPMTSPSMAIQMVPFRALRCRFGL
jgi:hypothetical protein